MQILQHQADFILSQSTHTGLVGGFRSGKTHSGVIKTILKKFEYSGKDVAYYLPTYQLIKDVAFPKFIEIFDYHNINYELNKTDKDIITPAGRIIFRSLDNHELIIGYEVAYSLVDEADVLPKSKMKEAMVKILSRNSVKLQGCNNATDFVSTPEGFSFMYDFFVKNANNNKKLIRARTSSNPFISENYINSLKSEYSQEQLMAYLNGEFVNFNSGNVYKFNRETDSTNREANEKDILHIGMDFNITNMNAVVHIKENGKSYAVDEFVEVYDTTTMIEKIREHYPKNYIYIYPDASGQNRSTSGKTDVQLLQAAGFKVKVLPKNPFVRDRVNELNKQFRDKTYFVNIKTCKNYVEALEQIGYKGGEPDKTSGYDHITEAGGYYAWQQRVLNFSIRV